MMENHSFALKSSRVVMGHRTAPGTLIIRGEKIVDILEPDDELSADIPLDDLGEKVIMPGLVDTHVHINEPGRTEWEGFNTATRAAAAGGVTTLVDMPLNCSPVTTSAAALQEKINSLQDKLWVDCGFWGGVVPRSMGDLDALVQAGVLGVKSFTIDSGIDEFPPVGEEHLRKAIQILAKYRLPYLIHAEVSPENEPPAQIGTSYQSFLQSRPRRWENQAIEMMIRLLAEAAAKDIYGHVHIVHLSSADAIAAIADARAAGLELTAETCPHYLTLCAENIPDGNTVYKCCPPIREDENRTRLWAGLAAGHIDFIVSDHSPCTPQLKNIDTGDLEKAWGGISSLQFGLSLIWTEASARGCNLADIANWMATRPARFAGLIGSKGKISVGYDADLVVFDDCAEYRISPGQILYRHKITPYEGRLVRGRVERTYLRGQAVYSALGDASDTPRGQPILKKY